MYNAQEKVKVLIRHHVHKGLKHVQHRELSGLVVLTGECLILASVNQDTQRGDMHIMQVDV